MAHRLGSNYHRCRGCVKTSIRVTSPEYRFCLASFLMTAEIVMQEHMLQSCLLYQSPCASKTQLVYIRWELRKMDDAVTDGSTEKDPVDNDLVNK